ncbi:hypothetical protein [Kutzneria chonburiensis]|uniref:Uncharacterized protein n=1 Tax=Kutzneria chonburiensis TaxID=1483604 RepID=A0ABV6N855_9PSEU|nr:hypothetical protein [Kutzneria chonburiensis]
MGESEAEVLAWCVVANVAEQTSHGEEEAELRRGLKHFAAGAKLWVLPAQWGDGGDSVFVVGRHRGRGPGRLARIVIERRHLTNFRVRGVYSPAVHRELVKPWKGWSSDHPLRLWDTRDDAEQAAQYWNRMSVGAAEVRRPHKRIELIEELSVLAGGRTWTVFRVAGLRPPYDLADVCRNDREVEAFTALHAVLRPMLAESGESGPYDRFAADPRWTVIVDAAANALATLTA